MLHHDQDQAQDCWKGSGVMEEVLGCPIDPGGAGRHQPLALGEGHNHSQDKASTLLALATCLQWTRVSPGSHFAVMFAGLAVPGQDLLAF